MAAFSPRQVYPGLSSIPRSYFLGHHRGALQQMKTRLPLTDLVVECRDYRTPIVSRNPLLEEALGEKPRLIVYTHHDLGSNGSLGDIQREQIIQRWDAPCSVMFANAKNPSTVKKILAFSKDKALNANSLLGLQLLIVGMPNVGKSSLLNALRSAEIGGRKTAKTGLQPGVTRKFASSVKVIQGNGEHAGVYVVDSPGIFVPYMPDSESMLKLALCGNIKDSLVLPEIVADYLLFRLNLHNPDLYQMFSSPTNDIHEVLQKVAKRYGRLGKGGVPDTKAAAIQLVHLWRTGQLGKFVLDDVTETALRERQEFLNASGGSIRQARKVEKLNRSTVMRTSEGTE